MDERKGTINRIKKGCYEALKATEKESIVKIRDYSYLYRSKPIRSKGFVMRINGKEVKE